MFAGCIFKGAMKMTIGEKIKELRKLQNKTQEELAKALNISCQAISKWENGQALPDITLVVPIAEFFKVSTDTLFDMNRKLSNDEWDKFWQGEAGKTDEEKLIWWENAVKAYPNEHKCLVKYAQALSKAAKHNLYNAEKNIMLGEKAIEICTRLLGESSDGFVRTIAAQCLVLFLYTDSSKPYADEEKAVAAAESATGFWACREILLERAYFVSKDKAAEQRNHNITIFLQKICNYMERYGETDSELYNSATKFIKGNA